MPENVLDALVRMAHAPRGLTDSAFPNSPPNAILPSSSASSREQSGRHLARVDEDERRIEKACDPAISACCARVGMRVK